MIQENFFTQIAKLLALPHIQRTLKKAEHMLDEDPELLSAVTSLQYSYGQIQKKMSSLCARRPELELCKKRSK